MIPRISLMPSDLIFQFKSTKFPVRLAYAMTINKSQGQSLEVAGVDQTNPCFSHGQSYFAAQELDQNLIYSYWEKITRHGM